MKKNVNVSVVLDYNEKLIPIATLNMSYLPARGETFKVYTGLNEEVQHDAGLMGRLQLQNLMVKHIHTTYTEHEEFFTILTALTGEYTSIADM